MSHKMFSKNLTVIYKTKDTLRLKNQPMSMCIIDLNKSLFFKFHYDYIKNKHGSNSVVKDITH